MANEVYLYENISDYAAERVNKQLGWFEGENVWLRMMTRGGYTPAGSAMLAGIERFEGDVNMSVDGDVSSMGAFMLLYGAEVEMVDMAEIMFHKAAYPKWYEPTDAEKENLKRENNRFKKKMEQRLGEAGAELIAKVFADERQDVYLTAAQAKKIGLVNKVKKLTPSQKAALGDRCHKQMLMDVSPKEAKKSNTNINQHNNNMELSPQELEVKLKEARDEGKAEGLALGIEQGTTEGKTAEQDRVGAWKAFETVDKEAVDQGIASGKVMTETERNQFLLKATVASKEAKADGDDNADDNDTPAGDAPTAEQKVAEANKKELEESLGLKLD